MPRARPPVPPVSPSSTWDSVKICRPPMVEVTAVNRITGRSSGTVIRQKVCRGEAPSTLAAS